MLLQNDPTLQVLPMAKNGCFLMSALWFISKRGKLPGMSSAINIELLKMLYKACSYPGGTTIRSDCYVKSYDRLAQWFGVVVIEPVRYEDDEYVCRPHEEEILEWENNGVTHATAGDGYGRVTYDPLGYWVQRYSARLVNKRIITWEIPRAYDY
jgi:hypothetical protein